MHHSTRVGMAPFGVADLDTDDIEREGAVDERVLFSKINRHLLPPFFIMVMLCYIDRTNLAFASIQLNADMEWPTSVYGFGSGLFFLGYATCQIPSNLILKRVGGPAWLSIIIVAWGVCATAFAFMKNRTHFYVLRMILGVAEAGAFPGMWFCLSQFIPPDALTVPFAIVETGVILSHVISAPLAAAVLSLDGTCGMRGWQWLFLLEGLPSILLGCVMRFMLPDSIDRATFLTNQERQHLTNRLNAAAAAAVGVAVPVVAAAKNSATGSRDMIWASLHNPFVWYMAVSKIVRDVAGFGIIFFTPLLVHAMLNGTVQKLHGTGVAGLHDAAHTAKPGDSGARAALLTSLPFAVSALVGLAVAHHSQARNERVLHIALPYIVCGMLFTAFPAMMHYSLTAGFVSLTAGVVGIYSGGAPNLALLSELAAGPGLVIALPMYNSIGNIGGFFGPWFVGWCLERYNSFTVALPVLGAALTLAGVMTLAMGPWLPGSAAGSRRPRAHA